VVAATESSEGRIELTATEQIRRGANCLQLELEIAGDGGIIIDCSFDKISESSIRCQLLSKQSPVCSLVLCHGSSGSLMCESSVRVCV
jgi:hypothetical protein